MTTAPPHGAFRRELRERALSVALDRLNSGGWVSVRMVDIAADVGVSRPTLYAEFGKKEDLGRALVQHEATRFIEGAMATLSRENGNPAEAIRLATVFTLEEASRSVIVAELLTAPPSDDGADDTLLASLTTQAGVIVEDAYQGLLEWFGSRCPDTSANDVAQAVDVIIRLVVSHVLSPGPGTPEQVGDAIARVALLLLPELGEPETSA